MTWYKVKDWRYKNYNDGKLGISVVETEKINESEISDIVYDTILNSVVDDMIDEYYEPVDVCGYNYPASVVLKSTDALAYDQLKDDCCELMIDGLIDEKPGKPTTYQEMISQCLIYWE